jgi:hypothetical protein
VKVLIFVDGLQVVDDNSARVGIPNEKLIPMPGYDHKRMCRHGSTSDSGVRLIFFEIEECIMQAISRSKSSKSHHA